MGIVSGKHVSTYEEDIYRWKSEMLFVLEA